MLDHFSSDKQNIALDALGSASQDPLCEIASKDNLKATDLL